MDKVGTPHFAQLVPLEDNQIGFIAVYDGAFDKDISDFTKNIEPVFDLLFKFTKGAPPSPCRKHLQEFIDFAARANRTPGVLNTQAPDTPDRTVWGATAEMWRRAGEEGSRLPFLVWQKRGSNFLFASEERRARLAAPAQNYGTSSPSSVSHSGDSKMRSIEVQLSDFTGRVGELRGSIYQSRFC